MIFFVLAFGCNPLSTSTSTRVIFLGTLKGRASFLGERSKGHIDPGARSSQLAIEAICNTIINT